jgi:RNA polymerase sigma factor (sigma-70 family)
MTSLEDAELLRRYAAKKSEAAFAELVRRHVNPVYAFALRRVGGDAHLAEDVAQVVFATLARKAASLADRPVLGGWLCRTTHFAARDVVRAESRRRTREQEAHLMHESSTDDSSAKIDWEKLQPVLDETMGELNDDDRDAVWLRFFEGRSFAEVGARLRLTENAARMRVERALDKLHAALTKRGVSSTAAVVGLALSNQASIAAPAGIAASVTGAALTGVGTGGNAGGWLALFTMSKIEIGIGAAIVVAIVATGIGDVRANHALRQELATASGQQEELGRLRAEGQELAAVVGKGESQSPDAAELAHLRQRAAQLKARPPWVTEAKIKTVAAAKNAGWATADAALETFIWARASGDHDALIANFKWVGNAKTQADTAFAQLSEAVRAKYGSADGLAGTVLFGGDTRGFSDYRWGRDGTLDIAMPVADDPLVSYWADSDPDARNARPGIMLRVRGWAQLASGKERQVVVDLCYAGGSWTMGSSVFSDVMWQKFVARIDQATGALLPAKK